MARPPGHRRGVPGDRRRDGDRLPRSRGFRLDRDEVLSIEFGRSERNEPQTQIGRPRGLRERQLMVVANVQGTDTNIDLRSGENVYFEASGEIRWDPNRRANPRVSRIRRTMQRDRCRIAPAHRSSAESATRLNSSSSAMIAKPSGCAIQAGYFSELTTTTCRTTPDTSRCL